MSTDSFSDNRRKRHIYMDSKLDDLPLTMEAYRVYCHLCRRAGCDNNAFPSYKSIGEACFRGSFPNSPTDSLRRKAIAAVNELITWNLINKTPRSVDGLHTSNHYSLTDMEDWFNSPTSPSTLSRGSKQSPNSVPTQNCYVGRAGGEVQHLEQGGKELSNNNAFSSPASLASPAPPALHHAESPWQTTSAGGTPPSAGGTPPSAGGTPPLVRGEHYPSAGGTPPLVRGEHYPSAGGTPKDYPIEDYPIEVYPVKREEPLSVENDLIGVEDFSSKQTPLPQPLNPTSQPQPHPEQKISDFSSLSNSDSSFQTEDPTSGSKVGGLFDNYEQTNIVPFPDVVERSARDTAKLQKYQQLDAEGITLKKPELVDWASLEIGSYVKTYRKSGCILTGGNDVSHEFAVYVASQNCKQRQEPTITLGFNVINKSEADPRCWQKLVAWVMEWQQQRQTGQTVNVAAVVDHQQELERIRQAANRKFEL